MQKRGAIQEIMDRPVAFAAAFLAFFVINYVFLFAVGATPDSITSDTSSGMHSSDTLSTISDPENPVRITARAINLDATVANPTSTDIEVLDAALLKGAVRYPTSAKLGVEGTVLLFGHSSYLPIVHNQAYKTFDGIQSLKDGDTVSVYSATTEYRYRITGVRVADASEDVVELPSAGKHLTLITCDSFSKKTNRFVVTADFIGAYLTN